MLYHYGFIERAEQPQRLSEGRKPLIYFLDREGASFLETKYDLPVDWKPKDNRVSQLFLDHLLQVNAIRVALTLSARQHAFSIDHWLDDKRLKSPQMKDQVELLGDGGKRTKAAVVPDAYFHLQTEEDSYNFFLEADMGTVTGESSKWERRDWGRKVRAYLEYYRSGGYEARYKTKDLRILTVTTGEARLTHLKGVTERAGGRARFWFTTFKRIENQDILLDHLNII